MKKIFYITIYTIATCVLISVHNFTAHAAKIVLDAPKNASSNGEPFSITLRIDTENTPISALSGVLSFPKDLVEIDSISTKGSVISLWIDKPDKPSTDRLNARSTISFEGVMPGGFIGVRNTVDTIEHPGVLFTVTMRPIHKGLLTLLIDQLELHAYDANGTGLPIENVFATVDVPDIDNPHSATKEHADRVESKTSEVILARSELIKNNAWYVVVHEDEATHPYSSIQIVETNSYDDTFISSYEWKEYSTPFILSDQNRSSYIHVKINYNDGTYAIKTIAPVENFSKKISLSRILSIIGLMALLLIIYYIKNVQHPRAKKHSLPV